MKRLFAEEAWEDYLYWQSTDKKMVGKINALLKDIEGSPYSGIGKPEPLRHEWSGFWSRRIDDKHRLIYRVIEEGNIVELLAFRTHYGDR